MIPQIFLYRIRIYNVSKHDTHDNIDFVFYQFENLFFNLDI